MPTDSNVLDNAQAAAYLGCTPKTLRAWVGQRKVPYYRVGRLVRFRRADLDAWLEARRVPEVNLPTVLAQEDRVGDLYGPIYGPRTAEGRNEWFAPIAQT